MISGRLVRVQAINHLLKVLVAVLLITVLIVLWRQGNSASIACCYGGSIVIINSLLQRWHLINAAKNAKSNAAINLHKAYRCVVERWCLTVAMFAVGFAALDLLPLPLITGFIVMQIALLVGTTIGLNTKYGK